MQVALGKAQKELEELKFSSAEEKKNMEEEIGDLKSAMAPAVDELETTRGLTTRAELVGVIRSLGEKVLGGIMYGFDNAVVQLKVANSGLELNTNGIWVLRKVENGQIVIP
ncbi:hypothetical protein A2U01_0057934, partial [Trifolium medium]|nr:hypothetical protein [Trifolium medium]